MERYIVLLRGINVGGKNTVAMPELKTLLEQGGFHDVKTYINSGNVILSTTDTNEAALKETCEALIKNKFQFDVLVIVVSVDDLSNAINQAPEWWDHDQESKHNAIFVLPPTKVETVMAAIESTKPEQEKVSCFGTIIFWSAPIETFSQTRWSKIVGSTFKNSITIRNANTVKKLVQLAK